MVGFTPPETGNAEPVAEIVFAERGASVGEGVGLLVSIGNGFDVPNGPVDDVAAGAVVFPKGENGFDASATRVLLGLGLGTGEAGVLFAATVNVFVCVTVWPVAGST